MESSLSPEIKKVFLHTESRSAVGTTGSHSGLHDRPGARTKFPDSQSSAFSATLSWPPSTDPNFQKEDDSLSCLVPQESREDCWAWLHDQERQLVAGSRKHSNNKKISIRVLVKITVVSPDLRFCFPRFQLCAINYCPKIWNGNFQI